MIDWRSNGPSWFEFEDLTGIRFEPMHPTARPGVHIKARRPMASRPPQPSRLIDVGSRLLAIAALVCGIVTAGATGLHLL